MANIIASPRYFKSKALLLKNEAAVGTDAVPTGLANWIEGRNISLTPMDAETVDRGIDMPYFGSGGKIQVAQYAKISFEVALAGSGTAGKAPKFGPALLACGFAETITADTSVVYNLVSTSLSASSIYLYMDGTLHRMIGARGTVSLSLAAKAIPKLKFDFDAAFVDPAAVVAPAVDRTGWQIEEPVSASKTTALTIGAKTFAMQQLDVALGNKLSRINLPGPQVEISITDRAATANSTIVAPALTDFDPFALAKSGVSNSVTVTHGSAAGRKVRIDLKAAATNVEYADIEGVLAYKLTFDCAPVAGNDEVALTFL